MKEPIPKPIIRMCNHCWHRDRKGPPICEVYENGIPLDYWKASIEEKPCPQFEEKPYTPPAEWLKIIDELE